MNPPFPTQTDGCLWGAVFSWVSGRPSFFGPDVQSQDSKSSPLPDRTLPLPSPLHLCHLCSHFVYVVHDILPSWLALRVLFCGVVGDGRLGGGLGSSLSSARLSRQRWEEGVGREGNKAPAGRPNTKGRRSSLPSRIERTQGCSLALSSPCLRAHVQYSSHSGRADSGDWMKLDIGSTA